MSEFNPEYFRTRSRDVMLCLAGAVIGIGGVFLADDAMDRLETNSEYQQGISEKICDTKSVQERQSYCRRAEDIEEMRKIGHQEYASGVALLLIGASTIIRYKVRLDHGQQEWEKLVPSLDSDFNHRWFNFLNENNIPEN